MKHIPSKKLLFSITLLLGLGLFTFGYADPPPDGGGAGGPSGDGGIGNSGPGDSGGSGTGPTGDGGSGAGPFGDGSGCCGKTVVAQDNNTETQTLTQTFTTTSSPLPSNPNRIRRTKEIIVIRERFAWLDFASFVDVIDQLDITNSEITF